ncbi:MAG: AAA family ATPase [Planctomycetaceae bacterium]|jgi:predicted kinase|nr:AAA family ATPase [Planctomycetaceae bacterium]
MKFNLHTIILLCGPSCCGKTFYAKNYLIPELRSFENGFRLNIQYIASDDWRRSVLGDTEMDLRDPANMFKLKFASEAAFNLLEQQLNQVTSFPVNAEFVIVDTTALNEDFRAKMIGIAKKNHYNIDLLLFDLPTREYYKYASGNDYVTNHIRRMRTEVFPHIGTNFYGQVLRIKNREQIPNITEIVDFDLYKRCHFPQDAVVVGDLHGCLEPLLEIEKATKNLPIIVLGDVIDKGGDSLGVLRHLKNNPDKYPLRILGNHEGYVYQYLHGQLTESPKHDYYTSISQYENNVEFHELIDWYFETAVPFVKIRDSVYVTHAPCNNKYIGKIDHQSRRKQRYISVSNETIEMIRDEASSWFPRHFFGHAAFRQVFEYRNKIGLDTGGVYGNAFSYYMTGKVHGIHAKTTYSEYQLLDVPNFGFDPNDLEPDEQQRIDYAIREKINFVSGTIAPTTSDLNRMKIEPIETAIETFKAKGVEVIHVQKKYMGSRCEAYISRDVTKCRLTSRNGYRIKRLHGHDGNEVTDLTPVYQSILAQQKIASIFEQYPEGEIILLDGELMPWYALGKELIEDQYRLIEQATASEFELLRSTGFETVLNDEYENPNYALFQQDKNISDKIVNSNKKATYRFLKNYRHVPISDMERYLQVYREQIAIYGAAKPIEYFPFDLLKIINTDGSEILFNNTPVKERYDMVSRDTGLLIDLRNEKDVVRLIDYFANLPSDTEGLVLKCNKPERSRIYMLKVRNEKYLTIIYGFDYLEPVKHEMLIHKKNVSKKLSISNREYELGWNIAAIPYCSIHGENEEYKQILAALIFEERKEVNIDPRL